MKWLGKRRLASGGPDVSTEKPTVVWYTIRTSVGKRHWAELPSMPHPLQREGDHVGA